MKIYIYNTLILLLTIFTFIKCNNQDISVPLNTEKRLTRIEVTQDDETWSQQFIYESNSLKPDTVKHNINDGSEYVIQYEGDNISEYEVFIAGKLKVRDSLVYNENGLLKEIYNFNYSSSGDFQLINLCEFLYDENGLVMEKRTKFVLEERYISIKKFRWENGNINQIDFFDGDENLLYSLEYLYDNKINTYRKFHPSHIYDPISQSINNHSGTLVLINNTSEILNCENLCEFDLEYDADEYLIMVNTNYGTEFKLEYE